MFITFEGSEGSGKSTQIDLAAEYLRSLEYTVVVSREPGGTNIGEQVRSCLHDVNNRNMAPEAEVLLYSASRAQYVSEVILPALESGAIVLSDRYADSTIAYQGYGRGLDLKALRQIIRFSTGGLKPNLTFLLEIGVEDGLERREIGGAEMNRMDLQSISFYERVEKGYKALVAAEPDRWVIIDANRPKDVVQDDIRKNLMERLAIGSGHKQ
ncbi:MAG: dTMP kinase [Anaerolineae bacterium]|nr:MAG: dTMP kinase [Anaerolineae bacterium]